MVPKAISQKASVQKESVPMTAKAETSADSFVEYEHLNDYEFLSDESVATEISKVVEYIHTALKNHLTTNESLALIKLFPSFPIELWNEYALTNQLKNWLAIPIKQDLRSTLAALVSFQDTLSKQRYTDPLTGIGNRGYFNKHFQHEFVRSVRSGEDLTLIIFDLDKFKNINDTFGHACGDMVLQEFAKMLTSSTRPYDYVARIGGEEFAVILPNTNTWTGLNLGDRLRKKLSEMSFTWKNKVFSITVSGGVASMSSMKKKVSTDTLFHDADTALYQAKNEGRNRIVLAHSSRPIQEYSTLVQADEKRFLFSNNKQDTE